MNWIVWLTLSISLINNSHGKCSFEETNLILKCISVDEEQLFNSLKKIGYRMESLEIENSFLPQVEMLPIYRNNIYSLTIENSSLKSISPIHEISDVDNLKYLNLGFNELKNMDVLSGTGRIPTILMNNNQIEFLNGSVIPNTDYLDLSFNYIKNFTTIQCRTLYNLNLSHNSLDEIRNLFAYTEDIGYLDLSFNQLESIERNDLNKLIYIRYINLSHNKIHVFEFELTNHLEVINLSNNKINRTFVFENRYFQQYPISINLEKNELEDTRNFMGFWEDLRINSLVLKNNKINSLTNFNFTKLKSYILDLSLNEIETLPASVFDGFVGEDLYLDHNKISSLDDFSFSGLNYLKTLNLSFNPLKTISRITFTNLSIDTLDLSHCLLKEVPDNFPKIIRSNLFLSHNLIDTIKPGMFSTLIILDVSHNKLKKFQTDTFSGLEIWEYLDLSFNPLESLERVFRNSRIRNVNLTGTSLTQISGSDVEGLNLITHLNLSNTGLRELVNNSFDQLSELRELYLDDNFIRILPSDFFGFNTKLETLSVLRNPISFIPLDVFPHKMTLKNFYLTINGRILQKRFQNLIFLEELHIQDSKITEIHEHSFKGLINLKKLNFKNSTVSKIEPGAFLGLSSLESLDDQSIFFNISVLKTKTFIGLDELECLNLTHVGVRTIENGAFFGLESLKNLSLSRNALGNIPENSFSGLKTLKMLDLSYNNLTGKESTFPIGIFKDLVELTHLHLQFNNIIEFYIGEFSNLGNLKFLNLSHNQLSYLDRQFFFPLRKLEVLDINSNHLIKFNYHFTLKHLSSLKFIGLGENKWPCESMAIMLNNFEDCRVNYREISKLEFNVKNVGGIYCVHVCNNIYCPTEGDLSLEL